ncbi:MAG: hypothetical protein IPL53_24890 [Ignavibacteria bacterium]|nr:hypothetical protein [Ignavibacteria bacterium]
MRKAFLYILILIIVTVFYSCAGVQFSSGIGIGISGGPYGPRITPTVNVGIYNGGYR